MKFIIGTITGAIIATIIIIGPYNVASSVIGFYKFLQRLV